MDPGHRAYVELPGRIEDALRRRLKGLSLHARTALRNQGPYLSGWLLARIIEQEQQNAEAMTGAPNSGRTAQAEVASARALVSRLPKLRHKASSAVQASLLRHWSPSTRADGGVEILVLALQPNATRAFLPVAERLGGRCTFLVEPADVLSQQLLDDAKQSWLPLALPSAKDALSLLPSARQIFTLTRPKNIKSLLLDLELEGLGLDLHSLAQRLSWPLARQLIRASQFSARLATALVCLKPQSLVFVTHRALLDQLLVELNYKGKVVFFLQGIVPDIPPLGTALHVDLAIAGSDLDAQYLERCQIKPENIALTGYPDYDALVELDVPTSRATLRSNLQVAGERPVVVFTSQYKTSAFPDIARWKQLEVIKALAQRRPDWVILIKPHPRLESLPESWRRGLPENLSVATEPGTIVAIAGADVLVTYWSTTALEAVLVGTPLVQLNVTGLPDYFPLSQRLNREVARDVEQLELLCADAISESGRTSFEVARRAFLREIGLSLDGGAADRAAAALLHLVG